MTPRSVTIVQVTCQPSLAGIAWMMARIIASALAARLSFFTTRRGNDRIIKLEQRTPIGDGRIAHKTPGLPKSVGLNVHAMCGKGKEHPCLHLRATRKWDSSSVTHQVRLVESADKGWTKSKGRASLRRPFSGNTFFECELTISVTDNRSREGKYHSRKEHS